MLANDKLLITSIQHLSLDDGVGLRTTVFLKGCPLRCPWCCNPETISRNIEFYLDGAKCIEYKGSKFCFDCRGLDDISKECYFKAREIVGKYYTVPKLYKEIEKGGYKNVTFSGGEPLLQQKKLIQLIKILKSEGYDIAIETALGVSPIDEMIENVDEWIIDLKFQFPIYTYIPLSYIPKAKYRIVVFSEIINDPKWIDWVIEKLKHFSINEIEFLCYHELGKSKYNKLGKNFKSFKIPSSKEISILSKKFEKSGIKTSYLTI